MAEADPLEFVVRGSSGHGSEPENGVDAVVTACHIITAMQTVVSRSVSPLDSAVVTIGTIHGGERANIIAKEVKVEGTCRSLRPEVGALIRTRLGDIARNVAAAFGAQCEFSCEPGYPPSSTIRRCFPLRSGPCAPRSATARASCQTP
jgi:metal-dependent amidase/aminoacylase/carboxypeptidase family protein